MAAVKVSAQLSLSLPEIFDPVLNFGYNRLKQPDSHEISDKGV